MTNIIAIDDLDSDEDEDLPETVINKCILPVLRDWLNPEDSYDTGYFKLKGTYDHRICTYGKNKGKPIRSIDMNLTLADCTRIIDLDFSCSDYKDYYDPEDDNLIDDRIAKVRKLLKVFETIERRLVQFKEGEDVKE